MRRIYRFKIWICIAAAMFLTTLLAGRAYAYDQLKGSTAAESTELDRAAYTDGTQFVNEPVSVETVRIGLCYGAGAVETAQFINDLDAGFCFGEYDAERTFHEHARTAVDNILVIYAELPDGWKLLAVNAYNQEILYTAPGDARSFAIYPLGGDGLGLTWFRGELYRGGFEFSIDHDYLFRVVNCLGLEDYVKGVVPYEMSNDWPYEALRAQAVCARTYVVYNQNAYPEYGFDLTDDTESQVYRGLLYANEITDQAVDSTAGEYIRYRGELCEIYYFASDGGATEDGINVFQSDRPYLLGKVDPYERAVDFSFNSWEEWRSGENLSWLLTQKGYEMDYVTSVQPEYSSLGNVIAVNFYDVVGRHVRIVGRDSYTFILLNNCRYTVQLAGKYYWFQGSGWGHNCGMSQWGARAMASVYGCDYQDIIRFYFTGAYVA